MDEKKIPIDVDDGLMTGTLDVLGIRPYVYYYFLSCLFLRLPKVISRDSSEADV